MSLGINIKLLIFRVEKSFPFFNTFNASSRIIFLLKDQLFRFCFKLPKYKFSPRVELTKHSFYS